MDPTDQQLQQLHIAARQTLGSLSDSRPLFVEFAGTPNSGKSTCIDTINHLFRRLGYNVLAPTEGASKRTPYYLKEDLVSFNTWSATYALTHILEGFYGADKYHLVIMDRGLFDALAWFELLKQNGNITEQDCSAIQDFLLIDHWRKLVDIVFLFRTDPDTSLARENQHKLIEEPGQTMNSGFLQDLNAAYDTTRKNHAGVFTKVQVIKTSGNPEITKQSTAFTVAESILAQLSRRLECSP